MSNKLNTGEKLAVNHELTSTNSKFSLKMQADGNLVVYRKSNNQPVWATGTIDNTVKNLAMDRDGNLVIYSTLSMPTSIEVIQQAQFIPIWESHTSGHPNSSLVLQNDGNLVISKGDARVWATGAADKRSELQPGEALLRNEELVSPDLRFSLRMQTDGNLVLYRNSDSQVVWSSETSDHFVKNLVMERGGNLTINARLLGRRDPIDGPIRPVQFIKIWETHTGIPNSKLVLQNDGNLVIYNGSTPVWDIWQAQKQIAINTIDNFYVRTNKELGPLGFGTSEVTRQPDGSYIQNFNFGNVKLNENMSIQAVTLYEASVTMAGIKCFGTDDPGGTDELYAIVTIMSFNEDGKSESTVITKQFNIVDIKAGQNQYINFDVGTIGISGSGIRIHVLLMDHEYGNTEEVRQRVHEYFTEAAQTAVTAIFGPVGSVLAGTILDSKIGKAIFGFLTDGVADLFSDDFIGEMTYSVTAGEIINLVQGHEQNFPNFRTSLLPSPALPEGVEYNTPLNGDGNPGWLIDNGSGSYKAYFRVEPSIRIRPIL